MFGAVIKSRRCYWVRRRGGRQKKPPLEVALMYLRDPFKSMLATDRKWLYGKRLGVRAVAESFVCVVIRKIVSRPSSAVAMVWVSFCSPVAAHD